MLKKLVMTGLIACLFSCTATLEENKFIAQSKEVNLYDNETVNDWKKQFPEHELNTISLKTADESAQLEGLYLDNPKSNTLLFLIQGNGMEVKKGGIDMLHSLALLPVDILIFDRRGVGASSGEATFNNLISDINEQFHFIKSKFKSDKDIVHGYSFGSFIAAQLAKSQNIDALVLQGTATNVDDWIEAKTPWYVQPFLTVNIDPVFHLVDNQVVVAEQYQNPLLIIAGEKDQQVPAELSQQLYNASQSKNKKLIIVEGANHGDMFKDPATTATYIEFLATL